MTDPDKTFQVGDVVQHRASMQRGVVLVARADECKVDPGFAPSRWIYNVALTKVTNGKAGA